jgi:hypothetical protein
VALDTYSNIKASIADYLDRSDLTTQIADFMTLAEKRIYRDLRVRAMETALSDTISSGTIAVPAGYLEAKYFYLDGSPIQPLQRKDLSFIYENYPTRSSDAKPVFYAREGANFIFGPFPNSDYTVKGIFYKKLAALAATTNETNFITDDIPAALLFGSLVEAEPFLQNDERLPVWQSRYAEVIRQAQADDDDEALSGSPLAVVAV